jgi:hypothetical protein
MTTVSGITKGSATNSLTAHRLSRAAIGFAVVSGSAGSSIITIAQPDETRGSIRHPGALMGHYGRTKCETHDFSNGFIDLTKSY